jgi:copper transport protein
MNRSVLRGTAAALLSLTALVALPASSVLAHSQLDASTPSANSVIDSSPPQIVLDFNEGIQASLSDVRLYDEKGAPIKLSSPSRGKDDSIVDIAVPPLQQGLYAVIWRIISADGHPVDGAFSFQIGTASKVNGIDLIQQVRDASKSKPGVSWLYALFRFLSLTGALVVLGGGMWSLQGRPRLGENVGVRRLVHRSWVALLIGSLGAFAMFGAQAVNGSVTSGLEPSTWSTIIGTQTGNMLLARLLLTLVIGVLVFRRVNTMLWVASSGLCAGGLLITFSGSGHPNALTPRAFWILVDVTHLAAIAAWLGGLLVLWKAGREWMAEPEAVRPARQFSLVSTIAVPVIIGTGLLQTWKLAKGFSDVAATDWGRLLLAKVLLVVVILAVAAVSRWLLIREGVASMRRTVISEAVIGIIVVGLAAGMVAQPPRPSIPHRDFAANLSTPAGLIANVTVGPGQVGSNDIHIIITSPGGSLTPVVGVTARVSLPKGGIPNSPITLKAEGPNHYSGKVTFPKSGVWTVELLVQVTDSNTVLLKNEDLTIP